MKVLIHNRLSQGRGLGKHYRLEVARRLAVWSTCHKVERREQRKTQVGLRIHKSHSALTGLGRDRKVKSRLKDDLASRRTWKNIRRICYKMKTQSPLFGNDGRLQDSAREYETLRGSHTAKLALCEAIFVTNGTRRRPPQRQYLEQPRMEDVLTG
ncbi:hypothetical protein I79_010420 [Cricetulus griseus]|uniref:Uncharacterized protein n=1 Tax=Cricetulus griseus TaxID=10029 RepID=G3HIF9_CRIGR|nr:hypothetical protein I79_010420 [Cricetulus griseus]